MDYRAELAFLENVLKKLRLQVRHLNADGATDRKIDFGLRTFLGLDEDYDQAFGQVNRWIKDNTIYKIADDFKCNYLFLRLPGLSGAEAFMVGPYMTSEISREQLLEQAERFKVPASRVPQLESFFANIPVIQDMAPLFAMINVFGETIWGSGNAFEIIDINRELAGIPNILPEMESGGETEDIMLHMKMMETRYSYENELMEMVSQGHSHRAELMLSGFSKLNLEQRMTDPIRNMKNYSIICNTLLRKAAEQGGVHPVYLDRASSDFAKRIETITSADRGEELMAEMVRTYCRLVRKHSTKHYSPLVQKVVTYIETDLSADLSLRALAGMQNINASYLSAMFRKETGKTVTEYVNEKRMDAAARLLRTTRLQIQTVAQHCGMSDVNYFSKIFKKHHGMTPKQFRERNIRTL